MMNLKNFWIGLSIVLLLGIGLYFANTFFGKTTYTFSDKDQNRLFTLTYPSNYERLTFDTELILNGKKSIGKTGFYLSISKNVPENGTDPINTPKKYEEMQANQYDLQNYPENLNVYYRYGYENKKIGKYDIYFFKHDNADHPAPNDGQSGIIFTNDGYYRIYWPYYYRSTALEIIKSIDGLN